MLIAGGWDCDAYSQSRSTSRMSDSEDEDTVAVIPVPKRPKKTKTSPSPALMQTNKGSLAVKNTKSPPSMKVGDGDSAFFPSTSPQFVSSSSGGGTPSRQFGRHGNTSATTPADEALASSHKKKRPSIIEAPESDDEVGALNSGRKKHGHGESRRPSVKLQPSSQQRKKNSVIDTSKKPTAKDYVASRVWKNESTMTFGMRVKLAEQPEMWADSAFAATNIVDVWEHYANPRTDEMGRHEMTELANDLVDRFVSMYRQQLIIERPALDEKAIQKAIQKDVFPHLLPGETVVEAKRTMIDRLFRELDLDSDGKVTKTEFFFSWKNTSKAWLTFKTPKGGLSCVIL